MRSLRLLICFGGILFAGCASLDRIPATTFEPLDGPNKERQFRFTAKSDIFYPANTPDGERIRMDWLETWLKSSNYCPNGYRILSKKDVQRGSYEGGRDYFYIGECLT
jgi:hypothetical protein